MINQQWVVKIAQATWTGTAFMTNRLKENVAEITTIRK